MRNGLYRYNGGAVSISIPRPLGEERGHGQEHRTEETLDPQDWDEVRRLGHRMVDDVLEYLRTVRERPAWQRPPETVRASLRGPVPRAPEGAERAYRDFLDNVLPYPS